MPYCVKCGHKVLEGAAFCTGCGAPLKNNVGASSPAQPAAPVQTPQAAPVQVPPVQAPPVQPAPPPPPPSPGSQPGSFRVTIRKKEAAPPPQRNMTPPPSYASQQQGFVAPNNGYNRMPRRSSGGSSFGGCLRRAFHGVTATIALVASLWWGINSLFPNLRTDMSGWTNGIFGKCSGGDHEGGGGLFGKSDAPSAKDYEPVFTEVETLKIIEEAGFPLSGEDHGLIMGTYETDEKMEGHTIAFKLEPSTSDDKRIVGNFTMLGDGNPVKQGVFCYCGHSLYCFYEDVEDIGHVSRTDMVWYAHGDGKSFGIYDKGEEKMKWTLKE